LPLASHIDRLPKD